MNWVTVVSSIFVLVGAAMLIAAGREFARTRALLRSSATAFGTIVALTENRERDENS
jgi:Trk-type K+ transport system membrane component